MNYFNYSPSLVDHEYEQSCELESVREKATMDMLNTLAAGERLKLQGVWCDHDEVISERVSFTDQEVDDYIQEQSEQNFEVNHEY